MKIPHALVFVLGLVAAGVLGSALTTWQLSAPRSSEAPMSSGFSGSDIASIEGIIKSYLLANPEVMRDGFRELEARSERQRIEESASLVVDNGEQIFREKDATIIGNPNGDITLVEFSDYNCPYCKRAVGDVERLIENDKNLRVVVKEFPILGEGSVEAAKVSLAVAKQGKYFEFHRKLFEVRGRKNSARALQLAQEMGLDMEKLDQDMKSDAVNDSITATLKLATILGIRGTPAFIVGSDIIPGAVGYEALRGAIAAARNTQ
ncbi:MAG: DsbA family protein [Alphaproteobacteria bacterium]